MSQAVGALLVYLETGLSTAFVDKSARSSRQAVVGIVSRPPRSRDRSVGHNPPPIHWNAPRYRRDAGRAIITVITNRWRRSEKSGRLGQPPDHDLNHGHSDPRFRGFAQPFKMGCPASRGIPKFVGTLNQLTAWHLFIPPLRTAPPIAPGCWSHRCALS